VGKNSPIWEPWISPVSSVCPWITPVTDSSNRAPGETRPLLPVSGEGPLRHAAHAAVAASGHAGARPGTHCIKLLFGRKVFGHISSTVCQSWLLINSIISFADKIHLHCKATWSRIFYFIWPFVSFIRKLRPKVLHQIDSRTRRRASCRPTRLRARRPSTSAKTSSTTDRRASRLSRRFSPPLVWGQGSFFYFVMFCHFLVIFLFFCRGFIAW
jgi:hypothetical protein